jgi:hypothetical protein
VTSETYRQSAHAAKPLLERDTYNRLIARQSRVRLEAEAVRDNALAVAGLLSEKIGGPSVHPYQPKGYWAHLNFPPREWDDSIGEDSRRGLYTHWQRAFLHELMAFERRRAKMRGRAHAPNTPQRAWAAERPTYVEGPPACPGRSCAGRQKLDQRLAWAYARALAREPHAEEGDPPLEAQASRQYGRDKPRPGRYERGHGAGAGQARSGSSRPGHRRACISSLPS